MLSWIYYIFPFSGREKQWILTTLRVTRTCTSLFSIFFPNWCDFDTLWQSIFFSSHFLVLVLVEIWMHVHFLTSSFHAWHRNKKKKKKDFSLTGAGPEVLEEETVETVASVLALNIFSVGYPWSWITSLPPHALTLEIHETAFSLSSISSHD